MRERTDKKADSVSAGKPDSWWLRVYLFVVAFTIAVITALGIFTSYFSR